MRSDEPMREIIPELPEGPFELCAEQVKEVILKKRNWIASGPHHIVNY